MVLLTYFGDSFATSHEHSSDGSKEEIFPLGPMIRNLRNWKDSPLMFIRKVAELDGKYPAMECLQEKSDDNCELTSDDKHDIDSLLDCLQEIAGTRGVIASIRAGCSYCVVRNAPSVASQACKVVLTRSIITARFLQSGLCCAAGKGLIADELIVVEVNEVAENLQFIPRRNLSVDVKGFKSHTYNRDRCVNICKSLSKYFSFRRDELDLQGRVMIYGLSDRISPIDLELVFMNHDQGNSNENRQDVEAWCQSVEAELSEDSFFSKFLDTSSHSLSYNVSGEGNSFFFVFFVFGEELQQRVWSDLKSIRDNKYQGFVECAHATISFDQKEFLEDWAAPACDLKHWPDVAPHSKMVIDTLDLDHALIFNDSGEVYCGCLGRNKPKKSFSAS